MDEADDAAVNEAGDDQPDATDAPAADAATAEHDGSADANSTPEAAAQNSIEDSVGETPDISLDSFYDALQEEGRPVATAQQIARRLGYSQAEAMDALDRLTETGDAEKLNVETDPVVWYPRNWRELAERERVVLFPERREIVIDQPTQFTRAQITQFAHLEDSTGDQGYLYKVRQEDIWQAPFEDLDGLLSTVRDVLPRRSPHLEEWIERQWTRARQFRLYTHEDGYTVLEADRESLMGNVARQKLDESYLRAPISDTESWVNDEAIAEIKQTLYEAGYPVEDDRDLETGEDLDVDLTASLRDYQQDWVERFESQGSGVFVGPPGSGKTIAAMGVLAAVGGETLVLVPSRELASQWHEELLAHTTLSPDQIGEYHGGQKEIRPVTIATYQTAGMDRHRKLFDSRRWGLIVYDEVQHIPSRIYRRSADLQSKHRLGLTATPVREDDREEDIFTLVGPPIGTDWSALFEHGYVQEPEVEIRYVPWTDDMARNEWANTDGHERRQLAATNPAKIDEIRHLLDQHPGGKALIFVDWLDQGKDISDALDVPFISGEMRHHRRRQLFTEFREGERDVLIVSRVGDEGIDLPNADLAIVASGLGGSRRQGAQRAGRTMRPVGGALMYVLATRGTTEEDFAQRRMRHLAEKGIKVREADLGDD